MKHASIRITQGSYFWARYVSRNIKASLGLLVLKKIFSTYEEAVLRLRPCFDAVLTVLALCHQEGDATFLATVEPELPCPQEMMNRVRFDEGIESNSLYRMALELVDALFAKIGKYLVNFQVGENA